MGEIREGEIEEGWEVRFEERFIEGCLSKYLNWNTAKVWFRGL